MINSDFDVGFSFQAVKSGKVFIYRDGKTVTTLSEKRAVEFLSQIAGADNEEAQMIMARITGNYKRGNERHKNVLHKK